MLLHWGTLEYVRARVCAHAYCSLWVGLNDSQVENFTAQYMHVFAAANGTVSCRHVTYSKYTAMIL